MTCCVTRIPVALTLSAGQLTIGTTYMHQAGFCVVDTSPLRQGPQKRGSDKLIPYSDGLRPKRRRRTATEVSLPMVIEGRILIDPGVEDPEPEDYCASEPLEGLLANVEWLMANLDAPVGGDGTRGLSLTTPGGDTITGAAHVSVSLGARNGSGLQRATLDLSLPYGRLA